VRKANDTGDDKSTKPSHPPTRNAKSTARKKRNEAIEPETYPRFFTVVSISIDSVYIVHFLIGVDVQCLSADGNG